MITQALAMAVYIIYPSCQNLRPQVFPRENVLSSLVGFLYAFDTNTGVFPSLHCAYSLGIASVWMREKSVSKWCKTFVVISVILICLSTMFIKQHSALDFFGAIPVCLLAEYLVFFFQKSLEKFQKMRYNIILEHSIQIFAGESNIFLRRE